MNNFEVLKEKSLQYFSYKKFYCYENLQPEDQLNILMNIFHDCEKYGATIDKYIG